jgi:hypothetical protein
MYIEIERKPMKTLKSETAQKCYRSLRRQKEFNADLRNGVLEVPLHL